jgi:hypothetical protein
MQAPERSRTRFNCQDDSQGSRSAALRLKQTRTASLLTRRLQDWARFFLSQTVTVPTPIGPLVWICVTAVCYADF